MSQNLFTPHFDTRQVTVWPFYKDTINNVLAESHFKVCGAPLPCEGTE